ncbi:hypothetical protein [Dichotomicrobium thermohalophilum]|uniref:Uncharacterized protein n=1 Tax=Dichotomicrobium thermohalophilum TaxID=933063 RepID=A0A397QA99_9HYPH|nr:hypothetical protein [Dichotomicrobium thermohalophilum]RIA56735.1 hypothetical protein BXY53_1843 [Dichotomicrobium thermohalophilum]
MVDLVMEYEWAIVLLGVIAYGFWELYALRRDKRRRGDSDSEA